MRRGTPLLLIGVLTLCPLLCGGGQASQSDGASGGAAHCCCCCHDDRPACPTGDSPSEDGAPAGRSCQCICGGAVVDDAGSQQVAFDWSWSSPVVTVEPAVSGRWDAEGAIGFAPATWPDVGTNRGRAVCCLFCTYLC